MHPVSMKQPLCYVAQRSPEASYEQVWQRINSQICIYYDRCRDDDVRFFLARIGAIIALAQHMDG